MNKLDFSTPLIMGVLNVTPDSFSDGGLYSSIDKAVEHAMEMVQNGAAIIDVGGESTRPGASPVSEQEELDRVIPVVQALKYEGVSVSVDTSTPKVMLESLAAGVEMLNDVRAFQKPGALDALRGSKAHLCVMHMQGDPETMQEKPHYNNVVDEVLDFLSQRLRTLRELGIRDEQMLVDPGFGFGKTLEHNAALLNNLGRLQELSCPILVGLSRKTMIGAILDKPVNERLFGSLAGALMALERGASVLRVHDVSETVDVVNVWKAVSAKELL